MDTEMSHAGILYYYNQATMETQLGFYFNVITSATVSWSSFFRRAGKAVRLPDGVLRSNTGDKGDLQQGPLLQDEEHLRLHQHKPVPLSLERTLNPPSTCCTQCRVVKYSTRKDATQRELQCSQGWITSFRWWKKYSDP